MSLRLVSAPNFRRFLLVNKGKPVSTYGLSHMRDPTYYNHKGFTFKDLKKHYEIIPLVAIVGVAVTGLITYVAYAFRTRPDVSMDHKTYEWDTMDVMHPRQLKMRVIKQEYKPMPELKEALSYREEYLKQESSH